MAHHAGGLGADLHLDLADGFDTGPPVGAAPNSAAASSTPLRAAIEDGRLGAGAPCRPTARWLQISTWPAAPSPPHTRS